MTRAYWLVKSDEFYPFDSLRAEGRAEWSGVRNAEARNNLRAMRVGDLALYYHSGQERAVVGVARVCRKAAQDSTSDDPRWFAVELEPGSRLPKAVPLASIKADPALREMPLVTRGRLSVMPVSRAQFERVLSLGGAKRPAERKGKRRTA
jgi:predicted RNA-binding protein with PUA-like domain